MLFHWAFLFFTPTYKNHVSHQKLFLWVSQCRWGGSSWPQVMMLVTETTTGGCVLAGQEGSQPPGTIQPRSTCLSLGNAACGGSSFPSRGTARAATSHWVGKVQRSSPSFHLCQFLRRQARDLRQKILLKLCGGKCPNVRPSMASIPFPQLTDKTPETWRGYHCCKQSWREETLIQETNKKKFYWDKVKYLPLDTQGVFRNRQC